MKVSSHGRSSFFFVIIKRQRKQINHWSKRIIRSSRSRVSAFSGPRPFTWPPALAPNLYLLVLAPNLYLPALAPNLYLPALTPNLYLPSLVSNLYLPALSPKLRLPQICIYRLNQAWVCICWPCLSPQFVFTDTGLWFVRTQAAKLIYPQWYWIM